MNNRVATNSRSNQPAYDESEADVDGSQAEAELHRMQRQLRALDNERRTYAEEARSILARQNSAVEKLRKDNQMLQEDLRQLRHQVSDDKKSGAGSKKAEQLKEEAAQCQQRIQDALTEAAAMDRHIAQMEKLATQRRVQLGGADSSAMQNALGKQVASLETRLNKSLIRYNKALEHNGKLRDQINVLRRERSAFQNSYKKIEKEMAERKKHMASIIQISTSAYEARDDSQARMVLLKERADKEHQSFIQEVRELERQLEQDRRLKEFLTIKVAERVDSSTKLKNAAKSLGAHKGSQELFMEKLDSMAKGFEQIRLVTKCEDVQALVKTFSEREDQNFSLFNYTNEAHSRIEALNAQIADTMKQLDNVQAHETDTEIIATLAKISQLDKSFAATESLTARLTEQDQSAKHAMTLIVKAVQEMAKLLGHEDTMSRCQSADDAQRIDFIIENSKAIVDDLWHIENRTNALLMKNMLISLPKKFTAAAVTQANEEKETSDDKANNAERASEPGASPAVLAQMLQDMLRAAEANGEGSDAGAQLTNILGQGPTAPAKKLVVQPPSVDADEYNTAEYDVKPMTRDELQERVQRVLEEKEMAISQKRTTDDYDSNSVSSAVQRRHHTSKTANSTLGRKARSNTARSTSSRA